ncbi:MAG: hypothetical protein H0U75_08745 [Legionella sp.]|nr:hypothetical protein [Legionella sp.]
MPHPTLATSVPLSTDYQSKFLRAGQSHLVRQRGFNSSFIEHLQDLAFMQQNESKKTGKAIPSCHLIYSPPSDDNQEEEYWIEPFLQIFAEHLRAVGIPVIINSIEEYADQFADTYQGCAIIFFGSKSLTDPRRVPNYSLNLMSFLVDFAKHHNQLIFPLLLNGTKEISFPQEFNFTQGIPNYHADYISTVKFVLDWLLRDQLSGVQEYDYLWQSFKEMSPEAFLEPGPEAIEIENALGFHKKDRPTLTRGYHKDFSHLTKIVPKIPRSSDLLGTTFQSPQPDHYLVERTSLLNKMTHHFNKKNGEILVLRAMHGMGKTSLAKYYFLKKDQAYTLRAWFNLGKTRDESLEQQYYKLAKENELMLSETLSREEKIRFIKNWLEQQPNSLLVYDNVSDITALDGFLPEMGTEQQIIISTCNKLKWSHKRQFSNLYLPLMDETDALNLIYRITEFSPASENDNKRVISTLHALPLALIQAAFYMQLKGLSAHTYLQRFNRDKRVFLNYIPQDSTCSKLLPVWQVFDADLEALKKECPEALMLLMQISLLARDSLSEMLLTQLLIWPPQNLKDVWPNVKQAIMRYSFLERTHTGFIMHPLLQDILCSRQEEPTKKETLTKIQIILKTMDPQSDTTLTSHLQHIEKQLQTEPAFTFFFSAVPEEKIESKSAASFSSLVANSTSTSGKGAFKTSYEIKLEAIRKALGKHALAPDEQAIYEKLLLKNACYQLSQKDGFVLEANSSIPYKDNELSALGLQPGQWEREKKGIDNYVFIRSRDSASQLDAKEPTPLTKAVMPSSDSMEEESVFTIKMS